MTATRVIEINTCIYCGDPGTTDEHIIPFALGGETLLRNASCESCRDRTSRCERNTLNTNWAAARAALDYPSRRRDFANEVFPLNVTLTNGANTTLQLNKEEALGLATFLEYPLPAFFNPDGYTSGVIVSGSTLIGFGPDVKKIVDTYGIKTVHHTSNEKGNQFETMLAKIAYCATVGVFGIDALDTRFVLPAVLNQKDDVGYWVGCDPTGAIVPLIGKVAAKNVVQVGVWQRANDETRYVVSRLKFFAASDAPEYIVVVGTLKPDFKAL